MKQKAEENGEEEAGGCAASCRAHLCRSSLAPSGGERTPPPEPPDERPAPPHSELLGERPPRLSRPSPLHRAHCPLLSRCCCCATLLSSRRVRRRSGAPLDSTRLDATPLHCTRSGRPDSYSGAYGHSDRNRLHGTNAQFVEWATAICSRAAFRATSPPSVSLSLPLPLSPPRRAHTRAGELSTIQSDPSRRVRRRAVISRRPDVRARAIAPRRAASLGFCSDCDSHCGAFARDRDAITCINTMCA